MCCLDEEEEETAGAAAEAASGGIGGAQGWRGAYHPGSRSRCPQPPAQAEAFHHTATRVRTTSPHRVGMYPCILKVRLVKKMAA